jgi:hypothetical protein
MKKLIVTLIAAATVLAVPSVAGAAQGPQDRISCWIPSRAPNVAGPTWRTRPDGVTEVLMQSGRHELLDGPTPLCTEVMPGNYVYTPEAPAVRAYLASLNAPEMVTFGGEQVTAALDLYDWGVLASCESGGDWHIDAGNGFYGGLQIALGTWRAYDGDLFAPLPSLASIDAQLTIARRVLDGQGPDAWPVCRRWAGWLS